MKEERAIIKVLAKKEIILILPADKATAVVIIDKEENTTKWNTMVSQTQIIMRN